MIGEIAADAAACSVQDVRVRFGDKLALDSVSLRVMPGEAVAFVGPSGAGKTTLLKVISGLQRPDTGEIEVMGIPLASVRPGKDMACLVGMMQQQLDLVPQLAVKHNVQAGNLGRWNTVKSLAALAFPIEAPDARDAVKRVGLEDRLGTRVGRLSGGEQQRVALARLLVQDPYLVLADEPVSALDPALADDHLGLLRSLTVAPDNAGSDKSPRTLIASIHQPDLALKYFDRVVGLRAGRVQFDKPAAEVNDGDLERVYSMAERNQAGETLEAQL